MSCVAFCSALNLPGQCSQKSDAGFDDPADVADSREDVSTETGCEVTAILATVTVMIVLVSGLFYLIRIMGLQWSEEEVEVGEVPEQSPSNGRRQEEVVRRSPSNSRRQEEIVRRSPSNSRQTEIVRRSPSNSRQQTKVLRRSPSNSRRQNGIFKRSPSNSRRSRRSPSNSRQQYHNDEVPPQDGTSVPSKPKPVLTSGGVNNSSNNARSAPSPVPGPSGNNGGYVQSLPLASDSLEGREVEALRKEVSSLRQELTRCRDTIKSMQEREKLLRDRLSDQVQKQFEKTSGKFEDLSLGENRPTQLLRRFGNLYSQVRLDAYDALDDLPDMMDFDDLKGKLLFSVVVLAFRSAQMTAHKIKSSIRSLLCIPQSERPDVVPADPLAQDIESSVAVYLRKSLDKYNISTNIHEVSEQVYATLFDYPSLRSCAGLKVYIEECVKLAWAVTVQNPPLVLEYEHRIFSQDLHTRFHSSNPDSDQIKTVLWPALLEGENGPCVHKGVVIT